MLQNLIILYNKNNKMHINKNSKNTDFRLSGYLPTVIRFNNVEQFELGKTIPSTTTLLIYYKFHE